MATVMETDEVHEHGDLALARPTTLADDRATKTIVIADDDGRIRELVGATLASLGCRVLAAGDGDEALRLIQVYRPVVAVLDGIMPGRHGLDVTRVVKADPQLARTFVIILSGATTERTALAAGADAALGKPFLPSALRRLVGQALA